MAKKKVKAEMTAPMAMDYKPCMCIRLEGTDVKQVESLKVGEKAEFRVTGTVKGLSEDSRMDMDGKKRTSGSIDLEDYKVEVLEDEDNEFTNMANDEAE